MKLKSITFRCSRPQLQRLESTMISCEENNRTSFITKALEEFLDYAEQPTIAVLDLFALVRDIDSTGSGDKFATQA